MHSDILCETCAALAAATNSKEHVYSVVSGLWTGATAPDGKGLSIILNVTDRARTFRIYCYNTAASMPSRDPDKIDLSALAHAQAALSQLTFHLNVQQTATEHAVVLAEEVKKHLCRAEPEPIFSNLPVCPIDLEPIEREDVRVLACGHVYHSECIEHWLDFSNTCPLDRSIVELTEESDGVSNSSATEDTPTHVYSESNVSANASSRRSSISSVGSAIVDMSLVETLAFHHRLIAEQELLVARAEELASEGTEVDLNNRWVEFVRRQIEGLSVKAVAVECEILGPDYGDADGYDAEAEGESSNV